MIDIILIVEDDKCTNEVLCNFLKREGYEVESALDGEEAIQKFNKSISLVVLDIMLPKKDGVEVLKYIRSISDVPVIVLTAVVDELMQLQVFDNAADEYVTKPFSPMVMVKRINSLLKRVSDNSSKTEFIKGYRFEFEKYNAYKGNIPVSLTTKEIQIIAMLFRNKGRVVTRQQILDTLFSDNYEVLERTVDTHIKNIRKKLGADFITTVKNVGYKIDN